MPLRVKISARAANEVRNAAEWWLLNRPAAPGAIRVDFGETVPQNPTFTTRDVGPEIGGLRAP